MPTRASKRTASTTNQAAPPDKGTNPSQAEIDAYILQLSEVHDIPVRALRALLSAESDFRQFDQSGQPLVSPNPNSSAAGLGQILRTTAGLYGKSYEKILWNWRYNMEVAAEIYAAGYHHPWNRLITDPQLRAARAYGMYHDGFEPRGALTLYSAHPRGYTRSPWEERYLLRY